MQGTSNHSSRRPYRPYQLTRAGSRLAQYLEYVESTATVSPDVQFGEILTMQEINRAEMQKLNADWDALQAGMAELNAAIDRNKIPAAPAVPPEQYDDDRPQPEDGGRDTEDADTGEPVDASNWFLPNDPALAGFERTDDDDDYGAHSPEED